MERITGIMAWPENFLTLLCILFTLIKGYGFRKRGFFTPYSSLILFLVLFALPMDLIPFFNNNFFIYIIMMIIYSLIYTLIFVDYPVYNAIATMISCLFVLTTAKKIIIDLLYIIFSPYFSSSVYNMLFYPLFYIAMAFLSIFYQKHPLKTHFRLPAKYWIMMFSIPILTYLNEHIFKIKPDSIQLSFLILIGIYYLSYVITHTYNQYSDSVLLGQRQALQLEHLERISTMVEQVRHDKHEMKNLFFYLQTELELKQYDELEKFVSRNLAKRYDRLEEFNTGNQFIDYLLTQKVNEAKEHHIMVMADVIIPEKLLVEGNDLCSLIMNLMDNAIDASKKEVDGDIIIQIKVEKNYLCVTVSNKSSVDVLKTNPHLKTSKADAANHGIGMRVIRSIVLKYNGIMQNYMHSGRYVVDIMLELPLPKK
ncbi:MAG TPA: GHKL domain-containing protein [Clostridiales bacterium]|nr:GHKL domain-containing protein [Clostridiales bacterium]